MQLDFLILLAGLAFIFTMVQRRPEFRSGLRAAFYVLLALVMWDRTQDDIKGNLKAAQPSELNLATIGTDSNGRLTP